MIRPCWMIACVSIALTAIAGAQQSAAPPAPPPSAGAERVTPTPEEMEPAVNTSDTAAASKSETDSSQSARRGSATTAKTGSAKAPSGRAAPGKVGSGKAQDRLELDATQITGNRELPKVLYIVPWKRSDLADLVGKPVNSLIDDVLQPVDRDVFKRENRYYQALQPDRVPPQAAPEQPAGPH